ncbi:hypothetical protein RB11310 [Rhodopirellula baltica SH 1]|uniref:Uncharacterized protein n=1 Tax=Rhodopirellula baltica (strain DSM 10527 / NCIMB 13988 / SH1) TaxID=243090 RepID=Q7UEI7_RHOBA|nr:hypothetical protein RB11310 [Rhodopirellula baltica SH 1]
MNPKKTLVAFWGPVWCLPRWVEYDLLPLENPFSSLSVHRSAQSRSVLDEATSSRRQESSPRPLPTRILRSHERIPVCGLPCR